MDILPYLIKLGISLIIGISIGFEREHSDKPAGVRTTALVTLGATIFTIISLDLIGVAQALNGANRYDFARIIAYSIVSMGFLGSGVLKNSKKSEGLTTSALLWVMVGIGILSGLGEFTKAIATGSIIYLVLISKYIGVKLFKRKK